MLTFDLAHSIMRFMEARSEAREAYLLTCRRLEQAKGSQLYSDEMKAASDKRAATVGEAQSRAKAEVKAILAKMRQNAGRIHSDPPSAEALAILQALQMRESVNADELEMVAGALDGNSLALAALDDIAKKSGQYTTYCRTMSRKLSRQAAESMIDELEKSVRRIVNDPVGAVPAAQVYAEHQKMLYGREMNPDELPQVQPYPDEFAFLEEAGIDDLNKFSAAVD